MKEENILEEFLKILLWNTYGQTRAGALITVISPPGSLGEAFRKLTEARMIQLLQQKGNRTLPIRCKKGAFTGSPQLTARAANQG